MKPFLAVLLSILMGLSAFAGPLPDNPKPKPCAASHVTAKKLLLWDAAMLTSTGFNSAGSYYGGLRCIQTDHDQRFLPPGPGKLTPSGELRTTLFRSLPVDAGAAIVSGVLHHFHHDKFALLIPISSASAQMGIAATQFSAGCF